MHAGDGAGSAAPRAPGHGAVARGARGARAGEGGAPLHVMIYTSSLANGGAEKHTVRVANHLDASRFRVTVVVARGGGAYEGDLASGVRLHVLPTGRFDSATLRLVRSIAPLRRLLRAERPDVLCSVMDHVNVAALLAVRGLRHRPATVLCVQNSPVAKYVRTGGPMAAALRRLIPLLYPRADRIVALSTGVAEEIRAMVPAAAPRIRVIYNAGVDDALLRGASEPLPGGAARGEGPLLVAVGRLTRQKGYDVMLDALARVRRRVPARLWIVGPGADQPALERQAAALGVLDAVHFWGFQRNPFAFMAAADLFVLSSRWEGFANVVAEAMACGAPVVSTDCPHGPGEIIQDGVSGVLARNEDAGSLAAAILRVLEDPELAARLAAAGRERSRRFRAEAVAAEYGTLFAEVAGKRGIAA
jgi:glycosyltransferase involved in cell wall biosynthesis